MEVVQHVGGGEGPRFCKNSGVFVCSHDENLGQVSPPLSPFLSQYIERVPICLSLLSRP